MNLVVAAIRGVEDEGLCSSGKFVFRPKCVDEFRGCHITARADEETRIVTELCVDRSFEAFVAVRMASFNHHFEDFVAVVFDVIYLHM